MTKLILIRHGQSLANAQNLFAGHSDFDLTDFGKEQAACAAAWLAEHETVDAIYASDLLRAYHTACPIGEAFGLPVVRDTKLREIYAGRWESMPFSAIAEQYAKAFDVWCNDYANARPVEGESNIEVYHRVVPQICKLAECHDGGCIVIATHATVVRAFDAFAKGLSAEQMGQTSFCYNAAINLYAYENGKASPIQTNIVEHLGDKTSALPPIISA